MAKKSQKTPERTKEEVSAFFDSWDGFNDYISKKIEAEEKAKKAKKKTKK